MSHFIDFSFNLNELRKQIENECNNLLSDLKTNYINTQENDIEITRADGPITISSIGFDSETYVKTDSGEVVNLNELGTDDMIAIYEHIWYRVTIK